MKMTINVTILFNFRFCNSYREVAERLGDVCRVEKAAKFRDAMQALVGQLLKICNAGILLSEFSLMLLFEFLNALL